MNGKSSWENWMIALVAVFSLGRVSPRLCPNA